MMERIEWWTQMVMGISIIVNTNGILTQETSIVSQPKDNSVTHSRSSE